MSRLVTGVLLVVVWVLLWGSVSPGVLLGGVAVAVALFVVFPSRQRTWPTRPIRPVPGLVLVGRFVLDVLVSNAWLTLAVLGPASRVRTALVWVDLQVDDPVTLTMVSNLVALNPGAIIVRVDHHDDGRPVVQVHTLATRDPERFARSIARLEVRCVRAIGTREQVAALRPAPPDGGICDGPRPAGAGPGAGGAA